MHLCSVCNRRTTNALDDDVDGDDDDNVKVISITVMPPSDFSVIEKFRTKKHFLKTACRTDCETAVWISAPNKLKPLDYHVWGSVTGQSQAPNKTVTCI